MNRTASTFFGVLVLGASLVLGYLSLRPKEEILSDNEVRVGVVSLDRSSWSLSRFGIGEPLVVIGFGVARKPTPGLAESWQRVQPCRWRFRLRSNIRFHDGTPLDADMVTRVLTGYFDEHWGNEAPVVGLRVERVDAMTVDVITAHPGFPAPLHLGRLLILTPDSFAEGAFSDRLIGTGPWKVQSLRYGDRMILLRNAEYWGGAPRLERLVVRQVADHQTRVLALEARDLDWSQMILRQDIARLREAGYPTARSEFFYDVFIHFNTEREPVDDVRVRQAVAYAIDRRKIAAGPFEGTADPASTIYPEQVPFFAGRQRRYGHDPDRARALLDAAGWRLRGDGGMRVKDGRQLVLPLLTRGNRPAHIQAGEIIQRELGEIGIRVELQTLEMGAWIAKVYGRGDFVATVNGRLPNWRGDPVAFVLTDFTSIRQAGTGDRKNACRLHDRHLDAIVRQAMSEADDERRTALVRDMQVILSELQPWVVLVHDRGRETFATAKGLAGIDTPFTRRFAFPGPTTCWTRRQERW